MEEKRALKDKQALKHQRRCHDCGRPTDDYRCKACWQKLGRNMEHGNGYGEDDF